MNDGARGALSSILGAVTLGIWVSLLLGGADAGATKTETILVVSTLLAFLPTVAELSARRGAPTLALAIGVTAGLAAYASDGPSQVFLASVALTSISHLALPAVLQPNGRGIAVAGVSILLGVTLASFVAARTSATVAVIVALVCVAVLAFVRQTDELFARATERTYRTHEATDIPKIGLVLLPLGISIACLAHPGSRGLGVVILGLSALVALIVSDRPVDDSVARAQLAVSPRRFVVSAALQTSVGATAVWAGLHLPQLGATVALCVTVSILGTASARGRAVAPTPAATATAVGIAGGAIWLVCYGGIAASVQPWVCTGALAALAFSARETSVDTTRERSPSASGLLLSFQLFGGLIVYGVVGSLVS